MSDVIHALGGSTIEPTDTTATAPTNTTPPVAGPAITSHLRERLVRLAYRFLWNIDDAEDVVQSAMLSMTANASQLTQHDRWWSWACRIVVHRCFSHRRQQAMQARHQPRLAIPIASYTQTKEPETQQALLRLIEQLPKRQQEVIVLRHFEQMSYEQIASVLGISAATARVHAQQAREKLLLAWKRTRGSIDA